MPQGFFRFGSVRLAWWEAWLEMSSTLVKTFGGWPAEATAGPPAATSPAAAKNAAKAGHHLLPRARCWPPAPCLDAGHDTWRLKAPFRLDQRPERPGPQSPAGLVTPTTDACRAGFSAPARRDGPGSG